MLNSHPNMKEDFKNDPTVMQYLIDLNANFCQNIVH
jgi:hypothetical protein